ncbi:hypothetical protein N7532_001764, partial [Penicillium argentinense]
PIFRVAIRYSSDQDVCTLRNFHNKPVFCFQFIFMRKSHKKSRHGCAECKRRRVKCDELRPSCTNCRRRTCNCNYSSSDSYMWLSADSSQNSSRSRFGFPQELMNLFSRLATPRGPIQCSESGSPVFDPTPLNLGNLELMILWSSKTHLSFTRDEKTQRVWQVLVPQEALSHIFLMHGLLATSALEAASSSDRISRVNYINTAVMHQNEALIGFQGILGQINCQNAKAIFAFASILVVYSFGFFHIENPAGTAIAMEDLYQVLMLCRGVQQIITRSESSIQGSSFSPVLDFSPVDYPVPLPGSVQFAVHQLREANASYGARRASHDTPLYQVAIAILEEALNASYQDRIAQNVVSRWAITLPQPFLERLNEREPMALVILGFFCVVLHRLKGIWYFRGWGISVMKLVWQTIPLQWKNLLHWPAVEVLGEAPEVHQPQLP